MHFNPHAREGRDDGGLKAVAALSHFNPHAREGRDSHMMELSYNQALLHQKREPQ